MRNGEEDRSRERSEGGQSSQISFWQACKLVFTPLLLQVICVLVLHRFDPCTGNPGCMAGSITGYSAIFILPATMLVLLFLTFIEVTSRKARYTMALRINSMFALMLFVPVFFYLFAYL